tara:strand:+ start:283 stop:495 length:213 start_codon:yes stop_codon:yes gene_type:complete
MTRKQHKTFFWTAVVILSILHVDFFNHGIEDPLLFGWLPIDLAYHFLWVVVAAALVFYFAHFIWRAPDER